MRSMMLAFICLLLAGCGSGGCIKTSFTGPTAEDKERSRLELKEADALVHGYAEKLERGNSGFARHEGLTDPDPWGNQIKVEYHQDWFQEVAVVRSFGPDGKPNTADDLTRTRTASNPGGILKGLPGWAWFVFVWVFCGSLALLASVGLSQRRAARGKPSKHRHPLIFSILVIALAPLAFIILGLQFIGGALGATGDFFDGFDFELEIDL